MEQGKADDMLGDWTEALKLWRSAGQSFESIGDRGGMADSLNHQADLAWKKDDTVNAAELFERSISLSNAIGDNVEEAYSLSRLGIVRMSVERATGGEMPMAVRMFRQATSIYHTIGNTAEEGYVISLLGDEAMQRSEYEEARAFYVKAMALSQAAKDKSRVAGRLLDLGIVDESEGHNTKSIEYFQQSSRAYEELGQKDRAAIARIRLGESLFRAGKIEDAESMLEASLATMRSFGRINQVREVLAGLTEVELLRNPAKAEVLNREGLRLEEKSPRRYYWAPRYAQLAEVELVLGKPSEAQEAIREAFLPGEKSLNVELLPNMLLDRGDVRMSDRNYPGASSDFRRSLLMARKRGDVYLELGARLGLAELHVRERGLTAKPELDRVKRDADQRGYGIFGIKIAAFLAFRNT
jgi:tetratricopeptide (TPR) repeat protein